MNEFTTGYMEFTFPNSDKYIGTFAAHRSGLAWREGFGLYVTHDGQTYAGTWRDDRLDESEEVEILYPNGDSYLGRIQRYKYEGAGAYCFANGARLAAHFEQNRPVAAVLYVDRRGGAWAGAVEGEDTVLCREHAFSALLTEGQGRGEPEAAPRAAEPAAMEAGADEVDYAALERKYFGKSKLTRSEINFEDSEWWRRFQVQQSVFAKMARSPSRSLLQTLNEEETEWYEEYLKGVAEKEEAIKENLYRSESNLLKIYFSDDYKKSTPIKVFYPTPLEENSDG